MKADKKAADAGKAVAAVEKTHKRAKALDADIKSTLKKIQGEKKIYFFFVSIKPYLMTYLFILSVYKWYLFCQPT